MVDITENIKTENPEKQEIKRDDKGRFVEGISGNPDGRPKGKTIKEEIMDFLKDNPDKRGEFIKELIGKYKPLVWQMLEGRPAQQLNVGNPGDLPFMIKIIKSEGTTEIKDYDNSASTTGTDSEVLPKAV